MLRGTGCDYQRQAARLTGLSHYDRSSRAAVRVCEIAYPCHSNPAIEKVSFVVNSSGGGLFGGASHDSNRESRAFWPFMWLSTLWVGISVALSTGGHPATAGLPLAAWLAHRRTANRT